MNPSKQQSNKKLTTAELKHHLDRVSVYRVTQELGLDIIGIISQNIILYQTWWNNIQIIKLSDNCLLKLFLLFSTHNNISNNYFQQSDTVNISTVSLSVSYVIVDDYCIL